MAGFVTLARAARLKTAVVLALELIGTIIFLAFPGTTAMIFTAFVPRSFDCGDGECDQPQTFLAADLGIEYHSVEHAAMRLYAGLMVAVWPLGVPLGVAVMFWRNRKELALLRAEQLAFEASLTVLTAQERGSSVRRRLERDSARDVFGSQSFGRSRQSSSRAMIAEARARQDHAEKTDLIFIQLHDRRWIESRLKHYELRCAWFDLVEIARKLLLTGFAVLLEQGSMGQLVAGCLLASAMLALTALLQPYKKWQDDLLAISCQGAVIANLALAILLHARRAKFENELLGFTDADVAAAEAEALNADEERVAHGLIAAAVTPIVGAVVLAIVQLLPARRPGLASRFRLRRRHPSKSPPAPPAKEEPSLSLAALSLSHRTPNQGALRSAREEESDLVPGALPRTPSLVGDISECHRPPLVRPPTMERVERARASNRASLVERVSSAVAGETTNQQPSFTEHAVALRI